jgi:hypothetical protein
MQQCAELIEWGRFWHTVWWPGDGPRAQHYFCHFPVKEGVGSGVDLDVGGVQS